MHANICLHKLSHEWLSCYVMLFLRCSVENNFVCFKARFDAGDIFSQFEAKSIGNEHVCRAFSSKGVIRKTCLGKVRWIRNYSHCLELLLFLLALLLWRKDRICYRTFFYNNSCIYRNKFPMIIAEHREVTI